MPDKPNLPQPSPDLELQALLNRATEIRQASGELVRQLRQLASEIAERRAIAADSTARERASRRRK